MDITNKEEPYKWTDKEIGLALIDIKPIITVALQDRLNLTLDKLTIPLLLATPITVPPATLITALPDTPIAIPLATLTAAPTTPNTPP